MTQKSHLDKLTNKKTLHETMFPKPAVAPDLPEVIENVQKTFALPKPKVKEIQRSFYLPPKLLLQFQAYRMQELGIKVDSKALAAILKEVLTQKGYWGPEYEEGEG